MNLTNLFRPRTAPYMVTYSGRKYYPSAPRTKDVYLEDIAHHLSLLCRFTGASSKFYSVAEHSVHVSYQVPARLALLGLMHDATEAYLGDVSRPLKCSLRAYRKIEALNWEVIAPVFGLPVEMPEEIHEADNAVLNAERCVLLPADSPWDVPGRAAQIVINCWNPEQAERAFLQRFHRLNNLIRYPVHFWKRGEQFALVGR